MKKRFHPERLLLLYGPWLLSLVFAADPVISYGIAWLGSFFIFFITLSGRIKPLACDLTWAAQLMRPLFLTQIIFAGYMSCTSIFYFIDTLGYSHFQAPLSNYLADIRQLELLAQCQRYYCLGHAALATGIIVFMHQSISIGYRLKGLPPTDFILFTALITLPLSLLFKIIPGLSQFYAQFSYLSFIAGTLALAFAIPQKKPLNILAGAALYASNFSAAFLSGFKEPIIISVLVLGIFLYPFYRKVVILTFIPLLFGLFMLLPTYNRIFREKAWQNDQNEETASDEALNEAFNLSAHNEDTNWNFLIYRLSEVSMFTRYVESTPARIDFYGFGLVKQSLMVITPRIFWPSKPYTEDMVMERVYDAGVIERGTTVSAKPAIIVDAYLSGGTLGILLTLFIYGAAAQYISEKAEYLFGGYINGTALIFSGLFHAFWRGLTFEFMLNSIFWSYISMLIIFHFLRASHILQKAE